MKEIISAIDLYVCQLKHINEWVEYSPKFMEHRRIIIAMVIERLSQRLVKSLLAPIVENDILSSSIGYNQDFINF
jgi:hypothetical protein